MNGKTQAVNGLAGFGTVDNSTLTPVTFTEGMTNASTTFSGVIQNSGGGAVSLLKTGTGTLTLNGQSLYTGGTTIGQGTVLLEHRTATGRHVAPTT